MLEKVPLQGRVIQAIRNNHCRLVLPEVETGTARRSVKSGIDLSIPCKHRKTGIARTDSDGASTECRASLSGVPGCGGSHDLWSKSIPCRSSQGNYAMRGPPGPGLRAVEDIRDSAGADPARPNERPAGSTGTQIPSEYIQPLMTQADLHSTRPRPTRNIRSVQSAQS